MKLRMISAKDVPDNEFFWRKGKPAMWLKVGQNHVRDLGEPSEILLFDFQEELVLEYYRDDQITDEDKDQIRSWTNNPEPHF